MATAANKPTTRDMPRLELRAEVAPSTVNVEKRTVEITWTTGARVKRGFWEPYYEELSLNSKHVRMDRLKSGRTPLLNAHRSYNLSDVIGVVEDARLEKTRGTATIRFDSGAEGEEVFRKVREGILSNISVGYRVHKMVKIEDGEDKVPVYRAEDWEPYELSVVPIGADAGAGTRAEQNDFNPCVFATRQENVMADEDKPTTAPSAEKLEETVAVAATTAARKERIEDAKARALAAQIAAEEATAAERVRASAIRKLGKQSGLGDEWATKLIDAGTTEEVARKAAFEHMLQRDDAEFNATGALRIDAGDDQRDKMIRGASAWLFERTGTRRLIEQAKVKQPEMFKGVELDGGEFRGLSPIELAREFLERSGVKTRGMDRMQMIGLAFTHRSGNYQVASDFAVLLENVLGKVLWGAYVTLPTTWEMFCGTDQVPDFRTSNRYYTGAFPSLLTVPEHAEYKNAAIPDGAKRAVTTERKGQILGLSREAIVNDDMGALTNVATEAGKAAGRTLEEDVYAFLALNSGLGPTQSDSQPFFHANRANVGTGAALSAAAIDADASVMSYQKDPSGKAFLNLQPAVLLVPRPLRGTAQTINDSQYDPDTVANKAQMKPNVVRGLFGNVIGSPYFASNATRRYLFADPNVTPAIVVAFLEGYGRGPIMETKDGWRTDGVEWKVTLYAKAQAGDPKGAVTNAGV